ncbi:MAG: ferrous iron transport protein A [Actinobacteria bacterium]|nr:ferrous iron transport protein A [Actinomycetota bacterium]
MTLDSLQVGEAAVVTGINGDAADAVARRLSDLGFLSGTPIVVRRRAPLGDPTVFDLRGYQMCLRRAEAQRVMVERVASQ